MLTSDVEGFGDNSIKAVATFTPVESHGTMVHEALVEGTDVCVKSRYI